MHHSFSIVKCVPYITYSS